MIEQLSLFLGALGICLIFAMIGYYFGKESTKIKNRDQYRTRIDFVRVLLLKSNEDAPDTNEIVTDTLHYLVGLLSQNSFAKMLEASLVMEATKRKLASITAETIKSKTIGKSESGYSPVYSGDKVMDPPRNP